MCMPRPWAETLWRQLYLKLGSVFNYRVANQTTSTIEMTLCGLCATSKGLRTFADIYSSFLCNHSLIEFMQSLHSIIDIGNNII